MASINFLRDFVELLSLYEFILNNSRACGTSSKVGTIGLSGRKGTGRGVTYFQRTRISQPLQ